jgi:hypothetical protein
VRNYKSDRTSYKQQISRRKDRYSKTKYTTLFSVRKQITVSALHTHQKGGWKSISPFHLGGGGEGFEKGNKKKRNIVKKEI